MCSREESSCTLELKKDSNLELDSMKGGHHEKDDYTKWNFRHQRQPHYWRRGYHRDDLGPTQELYALLIEGLLGPHISKNN